MAALVVPAAAAEYASRPQDVHIDDVHDAFSVFAFDTGYLPSISDPVSVRFHITPTGGVTTHMEATSHLEWPGLQHVVIGQPGTGELAIDTEVLIEAEVYINLPPLFSDSVSLWSERVRLLDVARFDPLLLDDDESVVVRIDGEGLIDPLEIEISVIFGLELVFAADFYPTVEATLAGGTIEAFSPHADWVLLTEEEPVVLPDLAEAMDALPVSLTYDPDLVTVMRFVIEPSASLDTIIGDFELLSFPIDLTLVDAPLERPFETVEIVHPLPLLAEVAKQLDFGELVVGRLAAENLPIENLGTLGLHGTARIEGDPSFTVWPEDIFASEEQTDGLVVHFLPTEVGAVAADLVIATNDPLLPEVRVPLSGVGARSSTGADPSGTEPSGTDPTDPDVVPEVVADLSPVEPERQCACGSGPSGLAGLWPLLFTLLGMRRRSA